MMVVQEQVMVLAEQDSVGRIGAATVSRPVLDVVRFAPGWRSVAVGPSASTVPFFEHAALATGEQPLLATQVERLAVLVEDEGDGALDAGEPLDRLDRHRDVTRRKPTMPGAGNELTFGHGDAHGGRSSAQELRGVHLGTRGDQPEEDIRRELLGAASVVGDLLGVILLADESRPSAPG
jgi:hypothetical protein